MRLHNLEFSKGFFVDFVMKGFRIFFGDHFTNCGVSLNIWKLTLVENILRYTRVKSNVD